MLPLAVVCLALTGVAVGLQLYWLCRFARRYPAEAAEATALPRAAVLLPVRGADPSLRDCLVGLLDQDYPAYDVYVVVDSPDDPAWDIVAQLRHDRPSDHLHVGLLHAPKATCSLKVSALLQAIGDLPPDCQVIALIDADVVPHPGWLRALVAPLADPRVGATCGVRWYDPGDARWGTLVRAHWNAAACTQMDAFAIPWGGSMALRSNVFRSQAFRETWAAALCDDTGACAVLRRFGLRLETVPAVTMMNGETIGLRSCFAFVRRQLLSARLYHPAWPIILAVGLTAGLTFLAAPGLLVAALLVGAWPAAACAGLAVAVHLGFGATVIALDGRVRRLVQGRPAAPAVSVKGLAALLLTQVVYLAGLVSAVLLRRVDWRGVTYEVAGPWDVRLLEYRPYRAPVQEPNRQASVV